MFFFVNLLLYLYLILDPVEFVAPFDIMFITEPISILFDISAAPLGFFLFYLTIMYVHMYWSEQNKKTPIWKKNLVFHSDVFLNHQNIHCYNLSNPI